MYKKNIAIFLISLLAIIITPNSFASNYLTDGAGASLNYISNGQYQGDFAEAHIDMDRGHLWLSIFQGGFNNPFKIISLNQVTAGIDYKNNYNLYTGMQYLANGKYQGNFIIGFTGTGCGVSGYYDDICLKIVNPNGEIIKSLPAITNISYGDFSIAYIPSTDKTYPNDLVIIYSGEGKDKNNNPIMVDNFNIIDQDGNTLYSKQISYQPNISITYINNGIYQGNFAISYSDLSDDIYFDILKMNGSQLVNPTFVDNGYIFGGSGNGYSHSGLAYIDSGAYQGDFAETHETNNISPFHDDEMYCDIFQLQSNNTISLIQYNQYDDGDYPTSLAYISNGPYQGSLAEVHEGSESSLYSDNFGLYFDSIFLGN